MGFIRSGDAINPITSRLPHPPQAIVSAFALSDISLSDSGVKRQKSFGAA
ncbi:hypothetical protein AB7M46_008167 [Bradyrhizobium elkanii]